MNNLSQAFTVEAGQFWQHKNGNVYKVLFLTNTSNLSELHPVQVIYEGRNGNKWSRPLSEWHKSMKMFIPEKKTS